MIVTSIYLSLLFSLVLAQPPVSALEIYENPMIPAEKTRILKNCRDTQVCCYELHTEWMKTVEVRSLVRINFLESHVYSAARAEIEHDGQFTYIPFYCYDARRYENLNYIANRRTGPHQMICPRTDKLLYNKYLSKLNHRPRNSVACVPQGPESREIVAGTTDCLTLENLAVTAKEAEAWTTTLKNENMHSTSYVNWLEVFPSGDWAQQQSGVNFMGSVVMKPRHKYRACAHAPAGEGNLWLNVAIAS